MSGQGQIVETLQEAKAYSYQTGFTGKDLLIETGMQRTTFYRLIKDCFKNKRIKAEGRPKRYFLPI